MVEGNCDVVIDILKTQSPYSRPLVDPSFLVPAVLDCLRGSDEYGEVTEVVPGEADHFCAVEISKHGGVLLTSDSDLLVHNLGEGRVAFLRDLHTQPRQGVRILSFAPKKIFQKIGLSYPEKAIHLAYERKNSPQASLSQLTAKCAKPAPQCDEYNAFQAEYTQYGEGIRFKEGRFVLPILHNLDPRVSEFVLQFCARGYDLDAHIPIRMFLPSLLECPALKSAWDGSTTVRQLAYSTASLIAPRKGSGLEIREFRRVESPSYNGRQIKPLSQDLARQSMRDILSCAKLLETKLHCKDEKFWIVLAMALDKMESRRRGSEPLVEVIEKELVGVTRNFGECISWVIVHACAQLQATWYSFRLLHQILQVISSPHVAELLPESTLLYALLSKLMNVELYPRTADLLQTARELQRSGLTRALDGDV